MDRLERIGVSIDGDLLAKFDALIDERGYTSRSEAFRDLIRNELVAEFSKSPNAEVVGSLTLVYDHHTRMLSNKLIDLQHKHHEAVLSTLHVHLDHDNCLEVLIIKGRSDHVRELADSLISTKGVKHGRLTISSGGKDV